MSLYGRYLKEAFGKEIVEDAEGFASYAIVGNECYVETVYVIPEARCQGKAPYLVNKIAEIAKEKGCTYLSTTINPGINNPEKSMRVITNYGFKFHSCDNNRIYFIKELKNV